jgi:hypothetical protein
MLLDYVRNYSKPMRPILQPVLKRLGAGRRKKRVGCGRRRTRMSGGSMKMTSRGMYQWSPDPMF